MYSGISFVGRNTEEDIFFKLLILKFRLLKVEEDLFMDFQTFYLQLRSTIPTRSVFLHNLILNCSVIFNEVHHTFTTQSFSSPMVKDFI